MSHPDVWSGFATIQTPRASQNSITQSERHARPIVSAVAAHVSPNDVPILHNLCALRAWLTGDCAIRAAVFSLVLMLALVTVPRNAI